MSRAPVKCLNSSFMDVRISFPFLVPLIPFQQHAYHQEYLKLSLRSCFLFPSFFSCKRCLPFPRFFQLILYSFKGPSFCSQTSLLPGSLPPPRLVWGTCLPWLFASLLFPLSCCVWSTGPAASPISHATSCTALKGLLFPHLHPKASPSPPALHIPLEITPFQTIRKAEC